MTIAKIPLAHLPTRIEPLPRLTAWLGGPQIFCKRDDQTGLGLGGNKTRKLEYLLAEAKHMDADLLVSVGALQSNHCRQVAALAARYGYECILVLSGDEPAIKSGNLLLDHLFGAKIVWATRENRESLLEEVIVTAQKNGRRPYKIPYGGSSTIGMLGYVEAMQELAAQSQEFDWVVTASSSGGTQAGMILGSLLHGYAGKILGICIEGNAIELGGVVDNLVEDCVIKNQLKVNYSSDSIIINDNYTGGGYGVMGPVEIEAISKFASLEGLLLDPVYTGRAAAGMIDLIRKGFFNDQERVLFWHTGGTPALFAETYQRSLQ